MNKISYTELKQDSTILVESYQIDDYSTYTSPYEGHYPHFNTSVNVTNITKEFKAGDIVIPVDQPGLRYIIETLEPNAVDSFFNWNFFDTILQQKEGFSPYVFEDTALEMLKNDTILKSEFENKKIEDLDFKNNWYLQLKWLFKHSKHYEEAYMQYPIYRITN